MKKATLFILLCWLMTMAKAVNYYVSTTGNDSNNGTSTGSAWRHINYAVNYSGLAAGDIIYILGGTYNERVIMTKSGSSSNVIKVVRYASENPIVDGNGITWTGSSDASGLFEVKGSNIIIDGLIVKNSMPGHGNGCGICVIGPGLNNITIRNCFTENTSSSGISAWGHVDAPSYNGITNLIIENNEVTKAMNGGYQEHVTIAWGVDTYEVRNNIIRDGLVPASNNKPIGIDSKINVRNGKVFGNTIYNLQKSNGIYVDGWDSRAYNIDIYNNTIYNVDEYGIQTAAEAGGSVDHVKIYNNVVYNCAKDGLKVTQVGSSALSDISFYNNTVFKCKSAAWVQGTANVSNITFKNNIFSRSTESNGVYVYDAVASNVSIANNLIWQFKNRSYTVSPDIMHELKGTNPIESNPEFIDTINFDFHLKSVSPAINAATSSLVPSTDKDGKSRPIGGGYDCGAYEYSTPAESDVMINFEDRPTSETQLNGTYANVNWGTNNWATLNSSSLGTKYLEMWSTSTSQVTKTFTIPANKVLKSLKLVVFGNPATKQVILSSTGNSTLTWTNITSSFTTFNTNWTTASSTVTVKITCSAGAAEIGIDDIVYGNVEDTQAPTVPTGISYSNLTSSSFTLSWSASTDNSGVVAGYEVFRNGTSIGTTANTSYNVSGLSESTSYSMTVRAYDGANVINYSAQSTPVNVTTTSLNTTINFEDRPTSETQLSGTYANVNWGTNNWATLNSSSLGTKYLEMWSTSTSQVTKTFTIPANKVLKSLKLVAFGNPATKQVILSSTGNSTLSWTNITSSFTTFNTNWTTAASTITVKITCSAGAAEIGIDDIVYGDPVISQQNMEISLSTNEKENNKIVVFPNPVINSLNILKISEGSKISIYNSNGKQIITKGSQENSLKIDMLDWKRGLYLLKIENNKETYYYKLIKQ